MLGRTGKTDANQSESGRMRLWYLGYTDSDKGDVVTRGRYTKTDERRINDKKGSRAQHEGEGGQGREGRKG